MQAHLAQNHQWVNAEEEERMQPVAFPDRQPPETCLLGVIKGKAKANTK